MEITVSDSGLTHSSWLAQAAGEAWARHPLKTKDTERSTQGVYLTVEPISIEDGFALPEDYFCLNMSGYPDVGLEVPHVHPAEVDKFPEFLYHEFTHLLDRHDPRFLKGRSLKDLDDEIKALPDDKDNRVRFTLYAYWNMYIDGRLERRGITVYTFQERRLTFLGIRPEEDVRPDEEENWRYIWNTEALSFDRLVDRAKQFPKPPSRPEWVRRRYGS